jgi:pimeloyl-ACP methyl ester carboxylesterase
VTAPVKLHHVVDGPTGGRRVLLLGGSLGTTLAMWEPRVAALAGDLTLVALDHRGHARSPVPVSGAQDPSIPAQHGRAIADAMPSARFTLLDPGAHLATVERAEAVNELIRGFVQERQ